MNKLAAVTAFPMHIFTKPSLLEPSLHVEIKILLRTKGITRLRYLVTTWYDFLLCKRHCCFESRRLVSSTARPLLCGPKRGQGGGYRLGPRILGRGLNMVTVEEGAAIGLDHLFSTLLLQTP